MIVTSKFKMPPSRKRRRLSGFGATGFVSTVGIDPAPGTGTLLANQGGKISLTNPTLVYYASSPSGLSIGAYRNPFFRLLAPGAYTCSDAAFGHPYGGGGKCFQGPIAAGGVIGQASGQLSAGTKVADEGQPFQVDSPTTIWYGTPGQYGGAFVGHNVPPGTFTCGNAQFGPYSGPSPRSCWSVPLLPPEAGSTPITYYDQLAAQQEAEDRAVAAKQAQQDLYQAQLAIQQQQADAAAQAALLAQNAAAQQAAAQSAAETYRQIQQAASDQAAALAAQLAKIAAANTADANAAAAAADVAAQAEALRQATIQAKADASKQALATQAAQAAALVESGKQQVYAAQLKAAQDAAAKQAELARSGGEAPAEGMSQTTKLLIYGGLAAAAVLILTSK